jgi:hypothetical protein
MLEPDQWDAVLSRITGTVYRGTERISSNALLNLLEVGPDPVTRQKVAKRALNFAVPSELLMCGEAGREKRFDLSLLRTDRRRWCRRGRRWT